MIIVISQMFNVPFNAHTLYSNLIWVLTIWKLHLVAP
jgi:hypothetical protein